MSPLKRHTQIPFAGHQIDNQTHEFIPFSIVPKKSSKKLAKPIKSEGLKINLKSNEDDDSCIIYNEIELPHNICSPPVSPLAKTAYFWSKP